MAVLEAGAYQTLQDGQERPIIAYLGELPVFVRQSLLKGFLARQVPGLLSVANDPKAKTLRLAFKGAARLAMDFIVLPKVKRGELPPVDAAACKADILAYSVTYWSDLILMGLASQPWDVQFVEQADGSIEITGMAPAAQGAGLLAEPAESGASAGAGDVAWETQSA